MLKILLLIVVASLVFLAFKGESVRRYFGGSESEAPPAMERKAEPVDDPTPKDPPRKRLNPY